MNRSIQTQVLASLIVVTASFSCSDGAGGGGQAPVVIAQVTINATGGELAAPDGSIKLRVPAGAVQQDTSLTLETSSAPTGAVGGKAFSIKPAGVTFAVPATVSVSYSAEEITGHSANELQIANYVSGRWQPLAGRLVDTASQQVSGTTQSIAAEPYAKIFAQGNSTSRDAGIKLGAGGSGTVNPGSGGTSGGTGGTCMPSAANGPPGGPYPTCADPGVCPSGYTVASCTNTSTGYMAQCCTTGMMTGGTTGSGGTFGSGGAAGAPTVDAGVTCKPIAQSTPQPPYPTCATSTFCSTQAGLPVLTNCVDGPTGYTAMCCP